MRRAADRSYRGRGAERADIHKLHRIGAIVATTAILIASSLALRAGLGSTALVVLVLVTAEFSVGIAAILTKLPIIVAVAHNGLAAMLLLGLLRLYALCKNRQALL